MKTHVPGKKYHNLVATFPLVAIKAESQHSSAIEVVAELHSRRLDSDEEQYLEALGILIQHYENIAYPRDWSDSPLQILHDLMASEALKQVDLARILSETSGRASEIYNGRRELSKSHIKTLAEYFQVQANLFLGLAPMAVSSNPLAMVNESKTKYVTSTKSAARIKNSGPEAKSNGKSLLPEKSRLRNEGASSWLDPCEEKL